MTRVLLIRHAQASAHAADYDQLSELGYKQSRHLAERLSELRPSMVLHGPRKRHLQTLETCAQPHWPEPELWNALDEYPAMEMLEHCLDEIGRLRPRLRADIRSIQEHDGSAGTAYAQVLKEGSLLWMSGSLTHPKLESYAEYSERLSEISNRASQFSEGPVLCFSSAGLISTVISSVVGGAPEQSLRTAWALHNTCISELIVHEGLSIAAVNRIDHIPSALRTFI